MAKKHELVIQFKDPDAIHEILSAQHPLPKDEDEITPAMEKKRDAFMEKYFEFGDYGQIAIDPTSMQCRLLPRKEWGHP